MAAPLDIVSGDRFDLGIDTARIVRGSGASAIEFGSAPPR